ncbi:MAG: sterol desaturase family protein [Rhizobiaceae bacterium]
MTQAPSTQLPTSLTRKIIRWGLYPLSWCIVLASFHLIHTSGTDPRTIWGATVGILAVLYLIIEFLFPYEYRWAMTLRSFIADLKYIVGNSLGVAATSALLATFAITISGDLNGPASTWPEPFQLLACLLIFEAGNYFAHRSMHEGRGWLGRFLWRSHSVHHLPPRLYLIMHAVFHPINGVIIQGIVIVIPVWLMGYNQEVVVMFLIINGMHGLISHFNVDIRMGWANYLFIGPELHRYHHSADVREAKNYGATLSVYDQLFGTFIYRPGQMPKELGVRPETGLPDYERYFEVMALPFRKDKGVE